MIRAAVATAMAVVVAVPPLAGWFAATMPRHQLIQLPLLIALGALAARGWKGGPGREWDPALLILGAGILLFWMVPRSIDAASSSAIADQLQHASCFVLGMILHHSLPRVSIVVPLAASIHVAAMLIAIGLVYTRYPGLICTAYNLEQQRVTGVILLYAGPLLGAAAWVLALYCTASHPRVSTAR